MFDNKNNLFGGRGGLMSAISTNAPAQPKQQKQTAMGMPAQNLMPSQPASTPTQVSKAWQLGGRNPALPQPAPQRQRSEVASPFVTQVTRGATPAIASTMAAQLGGRSPAMPQPASNMAGYAPPRQVRPVEVAEPVARMPAATAVPTAGTASAPPRQVQPVDAPVASAPQPISGDDNDLRQRIQTVQSVLSDRDADTGARRIAAQQLEQLSADPNYERVSTQSALAQMPADQRRVFLTQLREMLQAASPAERERFLFLLGRG